MAELSIDVSGDKLSEVTPRLFGMPYQFPDKVDPRVDSISKTLGRNFAQNIFPEGPIFTMIPGEPKYLSGKNKKYKTNTTNALLDAASDKMDTIRKLMDDNKLKYMRLYDFQRNYTDYINYVNILCQVGAMYLDIDDTISVGGTTYSFHRFHWEYYRFTDNATKTAVKKFTAAKSAAISKVKSNLKKKTSLKKLVFDTVKDIATDESVEELYTNYNYVQFYVAPDSGQNESMSNEVGESQLFGSILNKGESTVKELSFLLNSAGASNLNSIQKNIGEMTADFGDEINKKFGNRIAGALGRILNLSGDVVKGNNIVIPNIWKESGYGKDYTVTIHLKSPYGDKLGYYMNIFVPLMHLLAFALPRQASANAYSSPFLCKCYLEGVFTCNLGMVTSMSITKLDTSWTVDGLPNEVDVTLTIADLYTDLMLTPSYSPLQFINNASLVEFLATNCGLSITKPLMVKKYESMINLIKNKIDSIPSTVGSKVNETIQNWLSNISALY